MTTVQPLKPSRRRRDCTICCGEARYVIVVDGKRTKDLRCVWCRPK